MREATTLAFGTLPHQVHITRELSTGGAFGRAGLNPTRSNRPATRHTAVSELVGASEETGGVFDPLGLATDEVRGRAGPMLRSIRHGITVSGV